MGWPRRNSRKGLMDRASRIWRNIGRDWQCYRGDWQPSAGLRDRTRREIAHMREALDALEAAL